MGFPNGGEGGGPPLGKNSHIFPFFGGGERPLVESTFSGVTKKYHRCQKYCHSSGCTAAAVEKKGVGISRAVVILKGQAHSRFFNNKHNININAS